MEKVSIIVLTYRHEAFISACLDSILEQKADCEMEIIVSDDASDDNTAALLKTYAEAHPQILLNINPKNLGAAKNFERALGLSTGKYIAFCEGDDKWARADKLRLQLDAMRGNANAALCFANYSKIDHDGEILEHAVLGDIKNFGIDDLVDGHGPTINSMMLKCEIFPAVFPKAFYEVPNPDVFIYAWALNSGKAIYLQEVLSHYRLHELGIWSQKSEAEKRIIRYSTRMAVFKSLGKKHLRAYRLSEKRLVEALKKADKNADYFHKYKSALPLHKRLFL